MRARIATSGPDARAAEAILREQGFDICDAPDADLLVVDEWTPETAPIVEAARDVGLRVTVLAELLLHRAPGPVVGVTGTAGKTSTCRALEQILAACGVPVAISSTARSGNAWPDHSLVDQFVAARPGTVTVAELTSTHLCHMNDVHPDVAVVTMIRPDHVELHGSLEAYVAAKRRMVGELIESDAVILPTDDPGTLAALGPAPGRRWGFGATDDGTGAFGVPGGIVLRDDDSECTCPTELDGPLLRAALAACAAAMALGVAPAEVAGAIRALGEVAHRQARRPGPRGITIVDDSMAATPLKVHAAVRRFAGPDLVLVLGGDDALSGAPVHSSADEQALLRDSLVAARAATRAIVAFGPARARVRPHVEVDAEADDLAHALAAAIDLCPDGGTVLVSPMFPLTPADRELAAGSA